MKVTIRDFDYLTQFTENLEQQPIIIPEFEIESDFIEIDLPPGVCELVDIKKLIDKKILFLDRF